MMTAGVSSYIFANSQPTQPNPSPTSALSQPDLSPISARSQPDRSPILALSQPYLSPISALSQLDPTAIFRPGQQAPPPSDRALSPAPMRLCFSFIFLLFLFAAPPAARAVKHASTVKMELFKIPTTLTRQKTERTRARDQPPLYGRLRRSSLVARAQKPRPPTGCSRRALSGVTKSTQKAVGINKNRFAGEAARIVGS